MAFPGGLLGGGSDPMDIYGDLFTEQQRAALRDQQMTQGLLNAAAVLSKAGQASRLPVSIPWGEAAQALSGSGDEAMNRMLKGMQVAEEVRASRQKRGFADQVAEFARGLLAQEKQLGLPQGSLVKPYLAATGGATGGAPASNAPPPPPAYQNPDMGDVPARLMPSPSVSETGDTRMGLPPAGMSPFGLPPGDKQAGLLPPGQEAWAQYAGLLGGGPGGQPPFNHSVSDLTAQGSPDLNNIRIEQLSGEALPVDAPFPTLANPNKPRSAWQQGTRYDRGDTPFDPARPYATPQQFAAPPSELDRLSQLMKVETVAAKPAAASNLTGSAWEIANNNFGGMRRPGVNASPSQGGFQIFATPEAGLGAISHQLDRYASGATTGKPLSTIREIVSTWAPPSENDTETLINRASRVMGVADNIPLDLSNPTVKAKLIEATIRNEQGGKLPVDPGLIGRVANAPPGTYAASASSGFSGRIEPLGGDAAPAAATPASKIPGLNISPQGLGALNMLSKLGGLGEPFGSLLETYYKSPEYLAEKARTEAQAAKDVALKMDPLIQTQTDIAKSKVELEYKPKIEEAVQKLQSPILKEREQAKADIARYTKEIEINQQAGVTPVDVTVAEENGQPGARKILASEFAARQKDRAERIARGDMSIRPGDIISTPVLTPEQQAAQTERGKAPYTTGDITLTWPDGETRKVTVTGEQRKDVLEGRPVPAIGWPGTTGGGTPDGASAAAGGGRIGDVVYPPGYAEATTVMLKERRPKAEAAVQSLNFNETASRLLDAGIISGYGASFRLDVAKAKSLLGWSDERIANTETFLATQARQVAASLASGAFGSGSSVTDNDRQYAASMTGANSNLDEKSLRWLVRQNDTAARWEIDRYNSDVQRHDPKGRLPILRVDVPPKAETKPSANQPTPIGQSKIGDKSYVKWSDGQWRPEGELPGEEKR